MMRFITFGTSILLATTLVGCGNSSTAPEPVNFEGQYVLGGTIDGFPMLAAFQYCTHVAIENCTLGALT